MARRGRRLFDTSCFPDSQLSESGDTPNNVSSSHFVGKPFDVYGVNVFSPWIELGQQVQQAVFHPLDPSDLSILYENLSTSSLSQSELPETFATLLSVQDDVEIFLEAEPIDERPLWMAVVEQDALLNDLKPLSNLSCASPPLFESSMMLSQMLDLSYHLQQLEMMDCEDFIDLPQPSFMECLKEIEGPRESSEASPKLLLSNLLGPTVKFEMTAMETQKQWKEVLSQLDENEDNCQNMIQEMREEAWDLCCDIVINLVELSLQVAEKKRQSLRPKRLTMQKLFAMSSATRSEDVLGEKWDACLADAGIKMASGLAIGSVASLLILRRRVWPLVFGVGSGFGMAYANCQTSINTPAVAKRVPIAVDKAKK